MSERCSYQQIVDGNILRCMKFEHGDSAHFLGYNGRVQTDEVLRPPTEAEKERHD